MGKSVRIPDGWEYWTTELGWEAAWSTAMRLKLRREKLRHDLFVRVRVVPSGQPNTWWILRREESRP